MVIQSKNLTSKNLEIIDNIYYNFYDKYIKNYLWIYNSFLFYPYYRIFLENKIFGLQQFRKDSFFPTKFSIVNSLKTRNGYFTGFSSFFIASNLSFFSTKSLDFFSKNYNNFHIPHIITLFPMFILSYPFYLNSNKKVLKLPDYLELKNLKNILKLIFNKKNYRGLTYFIISSYLHYIPLINLYFLNRLESIRFTFVFLILPWIFF